jgi:hypothetical protein
VLAGHTALFITAGDLLGELAALDSESAQRSRLRKYAAPDLLLIDEVGYLSYSNRHADLLFELVSRRYQHKSTVVTTNQAFAEWGEACVVSLIDRLMHRAEVIRIEAIPTAPRRPRSAVRSARPSGSPRRPPHGRARWPHERADTAEPAGRPRDGATGTAHPTALDAQAALAVCEYLQALREALWLAYGSQVQQAWHDQIMPGAARVRSRRVVLSGLPRSTSRRPLAGPSAFVGATNC